MAPVHTVKAQLGWLQVRLSELFQNMWTLVVHHPEEKQDLILLTNIPIHTPAEAELVYSQWRRQLTVDQIYRFQQEPGLAIEDVRVYSLGARRRPFVLVPVAALSVYHF